MDRRQFIERSAGAGLLFVAGACSETDAQDTGSEMAAAGASRATAWGLQLYTVRSLMNEDVERTLAAVGAMGYREVEFAGYFDRSPEQIRRALDAEGLSAPAAHLSLEEFQNGVSEAIEAAGVIGHRYLVLPYLDAGSRPGGDVGGRAGISATDGYRRLADDMNGFGEECREAGLRFAYHNHDFELQSIDGAVPLDILIERTDPDLVAFEVDLFWLVHGGGDPLAYFARYPGRFELCHVKDRTAAGDMVDVGDGAIDFAEIFRHSEQAGLRHYFVEHDNPPDAAASVRASVTYLTSLSI